MLKQITFSASFFLLLLASVSCVSGQKNKSREFENSKVYASVKCSADTTVSYALILPPQYQSDKPCMLLILFDPHGDGLLPVNLFSADAAKNSFIIAGSNNSKNGMTTDQTTAIYRKMIADIKSRFTIEEKAVYLCGFSGGSRVSGAIAITESGVAGVVGCGAGLPNLNQNPVNPFSYLAISGNQDFNYTEMVTLDKAFEQAGYPHYLLVFDGIHQWPPSELIPEIFTWLRFDAMRQHVIPADNVEINLFIDKNAKIATAFSASGDAPREQETYFKMVHYLKGLKDVAPIEAEIDRLSSEKQVIEYHRQQDELAKLERDLQQEYAPQLELKSIGWWNAESSRLIEQANKPGNTGINQVYKRLLGYLSLNSYMLSNRALKQGELVSAAKFIEIYRLVDPANAEHRYMAAQLAALNQNPDDMFSALKQAFDLGFKDTNRMKADPDFKPYQKDARFKSLSAH